MKHEFALPSSKMNSNSVFLFVRNLQAWSGLDCCMSWLQVGTKQPVPSSLREFHLCIHGYRQAGFSV